MDESKNKVGYEINFTKYFYQKTFRKLTLSTFNISKNKVGYEINFTKYFYQYKPLRSMSEITQDLLKLEQESENLLKEIIK
jgi:type I restriction enzyme M protein